MLDIAAGVAMAFRMKKKAEEKGLKPGKYVTYLLVLWFGLEILGATIGIVIFEDTLAAMILGIIFAIIGAFIAFNIIKKAQPHFHMDQEILDSDLTH